MEDVGVKPEGLEGTGSQEAPITGTVDGWIESLMACKQLSEADVQRLCDKVWRLKHRLSITYTYMGKNRHAKFCKKNPTFSQW